MVFALPGVKDNRGRRRRTAAARQVDGSLDGRVRRFGGGRFSLEQHGEGGQSLLLWLIKKKRKKKSYVPDFRRSGDARVDGREKKEAESKTSSVCEERVFWRVGADAGTLCCRD